MPQFDGKAAIPGQHTAAQLYQMPLMAPVANHRLLAGPHIPVFKPSAAMQAAALPAFESQASNTPYFFPTNGVGSGHDAPSALATP
mgnify:CR=1 FL=1